MRFVGHVRAQNKGKRVLYLDYEAHETLAIALFAELEEQARKRFALLDLIAVHRLSRVEVGEAAVIIESCSGHRHEAFLATRFLIDELKKQLPIWKKEVYADDTYSWDQQGCHCVDTSTDGNKILQPVKRALKARNIVLETLRKKHVLLIGAGGLGCPLAIQLSALGIGSLTVCDNDVVHESNLARQFVYEVSNVGSNKALLLKQFIEQRTKDCAVFTVDNFMHEALARELFPRFDVVIDATDCMATKNISKRIAYEKQVPLVVASIYQLEGEVQVYEPKAGGACMSCYAHKSEETGMTCQDTGVLTHVCGVVSALAAEKALAVLAGSQQYAAEMILIEPMSMRVQSIEMVKDPHCFVCGTGLPKKLVRLTR